MLTQSLGLQKAQSRYYSYIWSPCRDLHHKRARPTRSSGRPTEYDQPLQYTRYARRILPGLPSNPKPWQSSRRFNPPYPTPSKVSERKALPPRVRKKVYVVFMLLHSVHHPSKKIKVTLSSSCGLYPLASRRLSETTKPQLFRFPRPTKWCFPRIRAQCG